MKFEVNILGQNVGFEGPNTAAEFDALTSEGQCLKLAMRDIMYRPVASPFRRAFISKLEELTSVKRLVVGKKKSGKNEVDVIETEEVYFERIKELKVTAPDKTWPETLALANEAGYAAVGKIEDVIKKAGQGRSDIAQQWIDKAETTIGKWRSGESSQEIFETRARGVLGDDWEGLGDDPSVETVAKAIKAFFSEI